MTDDDIAATLTAAFGAETAGGWTVTFDAPTARLSMNDRGHWTRRHKLTVLWKTAAWSAAVNQLGRSRSDRARPPCFVRVTFPVTYSRRRDSDNPAPTVKAIVDALVIAGVWPDDDPAHVETLPSRFERGGQVVVQLIPRAAVLV